MLMPTDPNPVFMERAIQLAIENVHLRQGRPICRGHCQEQRNIGEGANSVTSTNDPTAHGEINAIRNACRELNTFSLKGCEMYH